MDGPNNADQLGDRIFRMVASAALALGVGSGAWTISTTDDRYRASEAKRDLALRDVRIDALQREIDWIKNDVNRIDKQGPTIGNKYVLEELRSHDQRIKAIENDWRGHK